ncbi:response regulator [Roseomonas sp. NAR14]|uniref:Response regulator n=1 Tax=Roseomonas acroporae TaxID=2937791 RepID=A0A9X2BWV1_9PROT|nr:response regulator [Roseomonas acroporae]MCK8786491.1 response regulator [Roseomonas acroporae]
MSGEREALIRALPYARRYARALSGSQKRGDAVVAEALRGLLEGGAREDLAVDAQARLALYKAIGERARLASEAGVPDAAMGLTERMLLLLTALEDLSLDAAAAAVGLEPAAAADRLGAARGRLRDNASARVLIIEDEPIIAMDIQGLVEGCGHEVVGIAASEEEAVALAEAEKPSLVLADINLGAGGDGTSAVARILRRHEAPVIFVTAYPERLLTGETVEPAFVITKPFEPITLAIATYQAVTRGVPMAPPAA